MKSTFDFPHSQQQVEQAIERSVASSAEKQHASMGQSQNGLFQEFLKQLREQKLFEEGHSILVAVSGGLDSTVLAFLLAKAAKILKGRIHIAHIDHRTRGETSRQEAEWIRALGARLASPVHSVAVPDGIALNQNEFRKHRRKLLLELAKVIGVSAIATAHHADDNAETFLIRAISGTGIHGLKGMAPKDGLWIKPLLKFSRAELMDYAREQRLMWVEDPSNSRGQYLRNRIRNEFFPLLEEIRQSSVSNLSTVAQRLWEEEDEMSAWLTTQLEVFPKRTLPLGWLDKWPRSLKRRIFREWILRNGIESSPSIVEGLLDGNEMVHAQGVILCHSDHWIFYPENDFGSQWMNPQKLELNRRSFLGPSLAWSFLPKAPTPYHVYDLSVYLCQRVPAPKEDLRFCLEWDSLPRDLVLRPIRREDPKEAHEMLNTVQMPKPFRKVWPVLSSFQKPNEVYAVVGVGVLEPYRYARRGHCLIFECFFEESLLT